MERLVDWNFEVLLKLLKQVEAKRIVSGKERWADDEEPILERGEGCILEEVTDVIDLPKQFYGRPPLNPEYITLPKDVETSLRAYVSAVACAYHSNAFHSLERASQVTLALTKMLSRIIVKELVEIDEEEEEYDSDYESSDEDDDESSESEIETVEVTDSVAAHLHNHTFGITSDPLTQFALVFAAFIHAVDHTGIPNTLLAEEDPEVAALCSNRSIIQQRSVQKAWNKLMEPSFLPLRQYIYCDATELSRFRQVLVNSVLATDIEDEELQHIRMKRWEKTFSRVAVPTLDDINRKATIVMDCITTACCCCFHAFASWIVYEKWTSRRFEELYVAFQSGRSKDDPSLSFHQQELEFLDNYAIPLAMQLKDCDAFVVKGDEYLIYAIKNRQQLATKGKGMVSALVAKINDGQQLFTSPTPQKPSLKLEKDPDRISKRIQRLVSWDVEMLERLLKGVVAKRNALDDTDQADTSASWIGAEGFGIDEFTDSIEFPDFDPSTSPDKLDPDGVDLGDAVMSQLRDFVSYLSTKFRDLPFHSFERGSHVCMMTRKLLLRIVSNSNNVEMTENLSLQLHNKTYGISSDPLAQFAVVFASLITDIDHSGVPNVYLVKEGSDLAKRYKNRCISQQHSLHVAMNEFMESKYDDLRACIHSNEKDVKRFRQIVVNCVLCTDLLDDELVTLRKYRWQNAFVDNNNDDVNSSPSAKEITDRKATIVLETMIQCSSMFHATQNWHAYIKWNERHFEELYHAYQTKKSIDDDPCIFWWKNVLLYFDENVIPTAKKMSDTGVFDLNTGDEYLSFALSNRQHWASKGGDMIASMVAKFHWKEIEKLRSKKKLKRRSLSALQA